MKSSCDVQDGKNGGVPQQEFDEEQFFEQFAALEEGLALVQIQLRGLSENANFSAVSSGMFADQLAL